MKLQAEILKEAHKVFDIEVNALKKAQKFLDKNFARAIELCYKCKGKIIVTGIGKSGIIAQKIAATMASTGTLSVFLHPAEGLHGDLGILHRDDIIIAIGKSGESEELISIIPVIRKIGVSLISIVGDEDSVLAKNSQIVLCMGNVQEACHLKLAPTSSTTVALVIGDALAVVLSKLRKFKEEDFALLHPGGTLGKRLTLRVQDIMHNGSELPLVTEKKSIKDVLLIMTKKAMGAVLIVKKDGRLSGIITDGDLRRAIQKHKNLLTLKAQDIMTKKPIIVKKDMLAYDALQLMEERKSQLPVLPVIEKGNRAVGIIRIHDLVQAGI